MVTQPVWVLLLCLWIGTACSAGQFVMPPAASHAGTAPQVSSGCDAGTMSAHVNTDAVRLRAAPDLESKILKLLRKGEVYPVVGLNPDETWVQLWVKGVSQQTWVYAELVDLSCPLQVPPVAASHADAGGSETPSSASNQPQVELSLQKLVELAEEPETDFQELLRRSLRRLSRL